MTMGAHLCRGIFSLVLLATGARVHAQNSFSEDVTTPASRTPSAPAQTPAGASASEGVSRAPADAPRAPESDRTAAGATSRFAQVGRIEAEDFGVAPTGTLHSGPMHAPTPTRIPGGLVISTEALDALYAEQAGRFIVFDVLNGEEGLPGAQAARPAGQAGSFNDQTQREFGAYLQQVTQGNKDVPLVFYCQSVYCWMSYNAALRAINLGYTQVLWYRGGIEAWKQAGGPVFPRQ